MEAKKQQIIKAQTLPIKNEQDIVNVRRVVRDWAMQAKFNAINQTKIMTATSELARNVYRYAGSGNANIMLITDGMRQGLRVEFIDEGPGIADIKLAMKDGYTTGGGLGMGLSGTQRLVDYFNIDSQIGKGTRVNIILWK